jgi:NAD(P)-dependent dehydrogenase (short-subunit alcohol dehydrogenase family)
LQSTVFGANAVGKGKNVKIFAPERSAPGEPSLGGPIVISGGASGLGEAVARAVSRAGCKPVVFDRRDSSEFEGERVDVSVRSDVERAVAAVASRYGRLSGVVTCAGIDSCGKLEDVAAEDWERVIAVNLVGTVALVRAALPHLERERGRVVTIASTLGLRAVSDATAYCASKFGVVGFTRALAAETAGRVGVTLLIPGGMNTGFFEDRAEQYKPPAHVKLASPDDIADAVVYALTRSASCEIREMVVCPPTESSWP